MALSNRIQQYKYNNTKQFWEHFSNVSCKDISQVLCKP